MRCCVVLFVLWVCALWCDVGLCGQVLLFAVCVRVRVRLCLWWWGGGVLRLWLMGVLLLACCCVFIGGCCLCDVAVLLRVEWSARVLCACGFGWLVDGVWHCCVWLWSVDRVVRL